jgi:5'-methylthioadenosine phosphorylase
MARLGVLGGSGLYDMPDLTTVEHVQVDTPFGATSDAITIGELDGVSVAFLPRHGRGHRINPTNVPARANIYALKSLGVERVISVSAVGSLRQEFAPLDLVLPDQLIDRTKARPSTFFDDGIVAHIGFADPFCSDLTDHLAAEMERVDGLRFHRGGVYVCIEGPQFSTKAESRLYRQWGCDIIGMTALPEAKLAREAQLCYATIACVTDYDVWHESEQPVTVEMVVANLSRNVANAQRIVRQVARALPADRSAATCTCAHALQDAVMTDLAHVTPEQRERYGLLLGGRLDG